MVQSGQTRGMFAFKKRDVWQQGRFSKRGFTNRCDFL